MGACLFWKNVYVFDFGMMIIFNFQRRSAQKQQSHCLGFLIVSDGRNVTKGFTGIQDSQAYSELS